MRKIVVGFLLVFLCTANSYADEGMWLPLYLAKLNITDMQNKGLQLSAEDIYSVNNSSIKDAIVVFGGFCTGEVISSSGLVLTNHHCGYGAIQSHSSVENDYLSDGFWAMSKSEEIPNEDLFVKFLVRMADVTDEVLEGVTPEMSEEDRQAVIGNHIQEITAREKGDSEYDVNVRSFFEGNEYYLFVYETYRDVRLVGAPPSSIGKYGGDTDNWMWPRHTGDFSLFRIYTAPDGSPAAYSPDNVPMSPDYHLPISLDGVSENDFAMVLGYPGSTQRYLTSYGVDMAISQTNPNRVKVRQAKLDIYDKYMAADKDIKIKYASKYAGVSNYWKYFIGQTQGLEKLGISEKKKEIEQEFDRWVAEDEERQELYADVLETFEETYRDLQDFNMSYIYYLEAVRGTEAFRFAGNFSRLESLLTAEEKDQEAIDKMVQSLIEEAEGFFKDYSAKVDQEIMAKMMQMYHQDVPGEQQPEAIQAIASKYKGDFDKWATKTFSKSFFPSKEDVEEFLADPDGDKLLKDPIYQLVTELNGTFRGKIAPALRENYSKMERSQRLFIQALRQMYPDKKFYPDANFTMRLTYGQVLDYEPRDGVVYKNTTTLAGVMEKEDPTNEEFYVPAKLKDLYKAKDYGQYGENGELITCFITNNDITGGNSGSPVINGKGELIGLAFDGNWEAMSGDIAFEPELQRCINVDIRYVLFVIDKFANAGHLVEEMTLVSN